MTTRWVFTDPVLTTTWTMPRNPAEMTSPVPVRAITTQGVLAGSLIAFEGAATGKNWTFRGRMLNRSMYDTLTTWSQKQYRFTITDHFGRVITVAPVSFEYTPKNANPRNYYDGGYEFTCITLAITAPTVLDVWS